MNQLERYALSLPAGSVIRCNPRDFFGLLKYYDDRRRIAVPHTMQEQSINPGNGTAIVPDGTVAVGEYGH